MATNKNTYTELSDIVFQTTEGVVSIRSKGYLMKTHNEDSATLRSTSQNISCANMLVSEVPMLPSGSLAQIKHYQSRSKKSAL